MKTALQIAEEWVDSGLYVESAGPNRGPTIDALEKTFRMLGQPWCAMFACGAGHEASRSGASGIPWPFIAGSQSLLAWFRKKGWVSDDAQDILKWGGALAIRTDPDGKTGHVVMIAHRLTANGVVTAIGTVEGNTDKDGGRNGDRAWRHVRPIPLKGIWHFCRTDELAGGTWWPAPKET